ncbi:MAG TPA: alkaline phosphatase family protein [Candidatus Deferrimicrobiaceae bacterium]|nr:alkaline phosphatase family protein [Candidatus Deferrimicrobiaceae bacterium]
MSLPTFLAQARQHAAVGASLFAIIANLGAPVPAVAQRAAVTPIQHVIVIIGENRTFDHVYGTFKPKSGQTVANLLSKGIVNADGTPGINYELSAQYNAVDSGLYEISPGSKAAYWNIPAPETAGAPTAASDSDPAPFVTLSLAELAEPGLFPSYNKYLLTGATGLPHDVPDTRIPDVETLGSGTFQLTSATLPYDAYAASPVHRFYQMWQQTDCSVDTATSSNPSGCLNDLFPWVEVTIGAGSNGNPPPSRLNTGEGSTSMAFFNVTAGDAPYFKQLAQQYTISDNFHQSVEGGTGANHIMFGYADAIAYSNGKGSLATPPVNEIENPNPQAGTNNYYDQDGYSGGSYSNCHDLSQPGVPAVVNYLQSLNPPIEPNCAPDTYYLLNNYNPGFVGDGSLDSQYTKFAIPPTAQKHIGDSLSAAGVSYTYFGEGWDLYTSDPTGANPYDRYCNICNPFQYATDIMTNPAEREAHIQDTRSLYEDLVDGNLPAVSIVKPSGFTDGHPSSSKLDLFEGFVKKIVTQLQANPTLWASTAVFVTFDEGGGYYDSGYIQPLDFFGDGTRIPLVVISPFTTGGVVNHSYGDHVSIIKFIERNWGLPPITKRSRDNYPNPKATADNPYVPTNSPAIDDLFDLFNFGTK